MCVCRCVGVCVCRYVCVSVYVCMCVSLCVCVRARQLSPRPLPLPPPGLEDAPLNGLQLLLHPLQLVVGRVQTQLVRERHGEADGAAELLCVLCVCVCDKGVCVCCVCVCDKGVCVGVVV